MVGRTVIAFLIWAVFMAGVTGATSGMARAGTESDVKLVHEDEYYTYDFKAFSSSDSLEYYFVVESGPAIDVILFDSDYYDEYKAPYSTETMYYFECSELYSRGKTVRCDLPDSGNYYLVFDNTEWGKAWPDSDNLVDDVASVRFTITTPERSSTPYILFGVCAIIVLVGIIVIIVVAFRLRARKQAAMRGAGPAPPGYQPGYGGAAYGAQPPSYMHGSSAQVNEVPGSGQPAAYQQPMYAPPYNAQSQYQPQYQPQPQVQTAYGFEQTGPVQSSPGQGPLYVPPSVEQQSPSQMQQRPPQYKFEG